MKPQLDPTPLRSCPVCSASIRRWRSKSTPVGRFDIDRCSACGFAFANPRPTIEFLMEFYSASGHSRDGNPTGETIDSVLERERSSPNSTLDATRMIGTIRALLRDPEPSGARILDVGCGFGFFSREALRCGFQVVAIELASTERGIAEQMTGLPPVPVPFEDFDSPPESFSGIVMSQILEHALDVNQWISRARVLLRSGGVLAIALPNFGSLFRRLMQEKEPYISPPAHLNFFSPRSLSLLLERHGFEVREIQWVSRLPASTFEKRIPALGGAGIIAVARLAGLSLHLLDRLHLGMMINVYARRTRA
ncbi:MAG: class I SAM-dependent methyltransferase [Vicinamibacteria bacterium]